MDKPIPALPIDEKPQMKYPPLEPIRIVSVRWLALLLRYSPLLLFAYVLVIFVYYREQIGNGENQVDIIQVTEFLMFAVLILVTNAAFQKGSSIVNELWQTGVFRVEDKAKLESFMKRIEGLLNHWGFQIAFILTSLFIAALFTAVYSCAAQQASGVNLLFCNYGKSGLRTSKAIAEFLILPLVGVLVWRLLIIAWLIRQLGTLFDLNLLLDHPDKSGGLSPIGTLCFWIAAVTAVPATYLGTWLLVCTGSGNFCGDFIRIGLRLNTSQQNLLLVFLVSLLSFIWPLWSTHKVMEKKKAGLRLGQLSLIGQKIDLISKQLAENAERISVQNLDEDKQGILEQSEELQKRRKFLHQTYQNLEQYSVWPFNKSTVLQLISTQGIPLLSLTGIGEMIINVLRILLSNT